MPAFELLEPDRFELREPPSYRFEVTRRHAFGALGGGGLLTMWASDAAAQPPAERVEARIHPGDDGLFTVFSGKVEEGQDPRTELAMAAAEELGVPLGRVRVVLGDTARRPDDGITAGSRTTPATVPAVRRAAAAARGWLSPEKRLIENPRLREPGEWKIPGTGRWRSDAREIVTGAHRYPSDIEREGMLYGCVLRPPACGARPESVDVAAALRAGAAATSPAAPRRPPARRARRWRRWRRRRAGREGKNIPTRNCLNACGPPRGSGSSHWRAGRTRPNTAPPTSSTRRRSRAPPWPNGRRGG